MKIAFVVSKFPILSQTFILNQITGLLDLGHEVEIFAKSDPDEATVHPDVSKYALMQRLHRRAGMHKAGTTRILIAVRIVLTALITHPLRSLKCLAVVAGHRNLRTLRWLEVCLQFRDMHFDIIHCHFGPNGNIGAALKAIDPHAKLVTTFHGFDTRMYPRIHGEDVYRRLFVQADLFTANTSFTKQQVIKLGCDESKIAILPVGLRIERFAFQTRTLTPGQPVRILTIGRLVEKKGHEYVLRALAQVGRKHDNIFYTIAGDGPMQDSMRSLVAELHLNNVEFVGELAEDAILELYRQAHLFALASVTAADGDQEGQALVLQEAQACGIPVISTIHNGIPDGVMDGQSGFLVPEKDVAALADKLQYLIENPELWESMGRQGRSFVEKHYDIKMLNKRLVRMYEELLQPNTD